MPASLRHLLINLPESKFDPYKIINFSGLTADNIIDEIQKDNIFKVTPSRDGKFSKVENQNNATDWGKNNAAFPFHLDGGYYSPIPQFVILYCISPSIGGGRTFFTRSAEIIALLEKKYDKNFLKSLKIVYINPDKKTYTKPLIEDVEGGQQLNWYSSVYIAPDVALISNKNRRLLTQYISEFMQDMEKYLAEHILLKHSWQAGDLILFNNQLLLHGRERITGPNQRQLLRIWFDKVKPSTAEANL